MADKPLILALANPEPEIMPDLAKAVRHVGAERAVGPTRLLDPDRAEAETLETREALGPHKEGPGRGTDEREHTTQTKCREAAGRGDAGRSRVIRRERTVKPPENHEYTDRGEAPESEPERAVLGTGGVEKIVEFDLNAEEKALLDNSVKAVTNLVADMERLGF